MHTGFTRYERIYVMVVVVVSVWLNVSLAARVWPPSPGPTHLAPGTKAPPLKLTTLRDQPVTIPFTQGAAGTVLYFFSPTCPWCTKNAPSIEALSKAVGGRYAVVAVAEAAEKELVQTQLGAKPTSIPVYLLPKATQNAYLLRTLPTTLVIDRAGVVLRAWPGAYAGPRQSEVEQYFEVTLPALPAPVAPRRANPAGAGAPSIPETSDGSAAPRRDAR
jgi:peroxiredoxin